MSGVPESINIVLGEVRSCPGKIPQDTDGRPSVPILLINSLSSRQLGVAILILDGMIDLEIVHRLLQENPRGLDRLQENLSSIGRSTLCNSCGQLLNCALQRMVTTCGIDAYASAIRQFQA